MAQDGQEEGQEKSHDATPQKIQRAREKGDIAVSADVHAAASYIGLILAVMGFGAAAAGGALQGLAPWIGRVDELEGRVLGPSGMGVTSGLLMAALIPLIPLVLMPMIGVLGSLLAQQAITMAPSKLSPKLNRINPIEQAKSKYGPNGLFEFAKATVKLLTIGAVAWLWLSANLPALIDLAVQPPGEVGAALGRALVSLMSWITAIAVAVALVDLLWQRFSHLKKLRMTYEEVKQESKDVEGDPDIKRRRRARAEEVAKNRMLADVPKADVVVVNPTHYAVALTWSRASKEAPRCVAKGVDDTAAAIRARAMEAGVPIHHDPPSARALFAGVKIGEEVKPEHYKAVAAAIRFADDLRRRAAASQGGPA